MTLIVVGNEARTVLDRRDLVLEEQAARDRPELDDAGVRVAERTGPAVPRRGGQAELEPGRPLTGDAVGDRDGGAEEDVRVADVGGPPAPRRAIERPSPPEILGQRQVERRLPFRRNLG